MLYKITVSSCSAPPPYPTSFFLIAHIPTTAQIWLLCVLTNWNINSLRAGTLSLFFTADFLSAQCSKKMLSKY